MKARWHPALAPLFMTALSSIACNGSCRGDQGSGGARAGGLAVDAAPTNLVDLATCDPAGRRSDIAVGYTTQHLLGSHGPRTYGLFLPSTSSPSTPLPIIISFHGDGGNGASMRSAGFERVTQNGAVLVYPDGKDAAWDLETLPSENQDYVFFDELVADVARKSCIDPKRIFLFGFSRGGFFANQLACHRGQRVRAIVSSSGGGPYSNSGSDFDSHGIFSACTTPPTAAMIIHGDSDSTVPPIAGEKCVRHWRVQNGCGTASRAHDPSPCIAFDGCAADHPVIACTVPGMGHQIWSQAADASWSFFRSFH